jgi:hypothetical protein
MKKYIVSHKYIEIGGFHGRNYQGQANVFW